MEEDVIFDGENYHSNDKGYGFKEIVMNQLNRVVRNMSQEMRQGFWIYSKPSANITPEKSKYIGDSRKELTQSINVLHDLLLSKFDEDMKKNSKEINEEIDNLKEDAKENKDNSKEYWDKKLKLYRNLFQKLCLFLERLGWLESEAIEE
jgi:cell division protein ZapA (FtsZ GTPase activity inhibitor)